MDLSPIAAILISLAAFSHTIDPLKEIFNVELLKDCICATDNSGIVRSHGLLVMYETSCANKLTELGISKVGLPTEQYLTYMEHDIGRLPQCHWYDLPPEDQLITYFPVIGCPTAYFIRRGKLFNQDPEMWMASSSSNRTFAEWVWDQLLVDVEVKNMMKDPVLIQAGGVGPHQINGQIIMPDHKTVIRTCESHFLTAFKLSESSPSAFLDGWVVNKNLKVVEVKEEGKKTQVDWTNDALKLEASNRLGKDTWTFAHTYRHLLNLKQALLVPPFTSTGYKKLKINQKLFGPLSEYYHMHKQRRHRENWNLADSILNQDEVKCYIVDLDDDIKEHITKFVQPELEEWTGVKLERTVIYGIREYGKGSVLKNHVDRVETHIVSAILQISKDLDGEADWPLEVIDYDGKRHEVYLESGDMLMYESAKLIHGRPQPLQGRNFANVFVHFKPKEGWDFKLNQYPTKSITYGGKTEELLPLDTELTKMWRFRKEEL